MTMVSRFCSDTLEGNLLRCIVVSTDEDKIPQKRLKAGKMCSILVSVSQNLTREIKYNKVHGVLA